MSQLYVFFARNCDILPSGIQPQITPDVQTHCLLGTLIHVVFIIE